MRADVVDLSHYDDVTDGFAGFKQLGGIGVINKVTEGLGHVDPSFNWRRGPANRAGLLYGAYHFLRPGNAIAQAKFFLKQVGDPAGLRLALDHEDPDVTMAAARNFLVTIRELTGGWPAYYSYQAFVLERARAMDAKVFANCPLWIAAYNNNPQWPKNIWSNYDLHQFTGDGNGPEPHHVPGIVIAGGCDINIAHDRDGLGASWATVKKPVKIAAVAAPAESEIDPSPVLRIAQNSKIANYNWSGRGRAPIGYTKGVALTFARCLKNLSRGGSPVVQAMAGANTHNAEKDVLSWYAGIFESRGMSNDSQGAITLRHLFALLLGLGMRESSGVFTEGRDMSAENTSSDTAEAGLFQQSWNSHVAAPDLFNNLMDTYLSDVDGFVDIFREGVSKPMSGNYGGGRGRAFQALCKNKPAFACEAAALGLRVIRKHWGPIDRYQAEVCTAADLMLRQVQEVVAAGALTS